MSIRILGRDMPHWGVRASSRAIRAVPTYVGGGERAGGGVLPPARSCQIGPVPNRSTVAVAGASPDVHRDSRTHSGGNPFP